MFDQEAAYAETTTTFRRRCPSRSAATRLQTASGAVWSNPLPTIEPGWKPSRPIGLRTMSAMQSGWWRDATWSRVSESRNRARGASRRIPRDGGSDQPLAFAALPLRRASLDTTPLKARSRTLAHAGGLLPGRGVDATEHEVRAPSLIAHRVLVRSRVPRRARPARARICLCSSKHPRRCSMCAAKRAHIRTGGSFVDGWLSDPDSVRVD